MPESSPSLEYAEAADRLFTDIADPQARLLSGTCPQDIWAALEEVMFPAAWVPEQAGGAGLGAVEVGQIVESAGRHALSEPLVETILARHWAARAGLELPGEGPVGFGTEPVEGGAAPRGVPDGPVTLVAPASGEAGPMLMCFAVEPKGALAAQDQAPLPASLLDLKASAAAMASAWIAGAMRGLLGMCVAYAGERQAFGRSIGKFQAIQHHIAHLATEVAAAELAARTALAAIDAGEGLFPAAAAKTRADEAGRLGCRVAHQVFGAIGFTIEHPLHLYTGGIEHWRNRYGSGPEWAVRIGHAALAQGGAGLWPAITDTARLTQAMEARADA